MATVKPFKGIIYNKGKVGKVEKVIAPPYDVIPKEMQASLYRRDPHNVVRLILGKIYPGDTSRNNRYTRAKRSFDSWLKGGVMVRDEADSLYIYSQTYRYGGRRFERTGFMGLMGLDGGKGKDSVLSHENTLRAPKVDRLSLIRSIKANLSPIFVLYEDGRHAIVNILKRHCRAKRPLIDLYYDDVRHRMWRLDDARDIKRIEALMRPKDIFIADGHHRYEVARAYSAEVQRRGAGDELKKNSKSMMVYFVESDERMLTILPAHRLVKDIGALKEGDILQRVERSFFVQKMRSMKVLMGALERSGGAHAFGMYTGKGRFYLLKLKSVAYSDRVIRENSDTWKRLDVTILHLFLMQHVLGIRDEDDNVEFVKDPGELPGLVDKRRFKIAFFLNPTMVSQVKRIARMGERMPRKATYFYPKPLSGLVINKLN
ncbi:MAG: DUF1015 domain-containing protein [Candidatus Omnitrophota bacterium]